MMSCLKICVLWIWVSGRHTRRTESSSHAQPFIMRQLQPYVPRRPIFSCYYCNLEGHIKSNCRKMMNGIKSQKDITTSY